MHTKIGCKNFTFNNILLHCKICKYLPCAINSKNLQFIMCFLKVALEHKIFLQSTTECFIFLLCMFFTFAYDIVIFLVRFFSCTYNFVNCTIYCNIIYARLILARWIFSFYFGYICLVPYQGKDPTTSTGLSFVYVSAYI